MFKGCDFMRNSFRWVEEPEKIGERLFTFDGITIFNLFRDYPYKLTPEQKEIFDEMKMSGKLIQDAKASSPIE